VNPQFIESVISLKALPVLVLVVFSAPLVLLASWKRIYPHAPLVILMLAPFLLTFGVLAWASWLYVVLLIDAVILAVAFGDLFTLPNARAFSTEREAMRIASLKQNHRVTLTISNHERRSLNVWIRDDVPQEFEPTPKQFVVRMADRSRVTMHYEMKASRRGSFRMKFVHLRVRSLFGLWQRYLSYPVESLIYVYPDMKQLAEYAMLARTNRLSLLGVRRTRKVGQDNDFERLRDYTLDDNYKHIDWRTTARRGKLTVKDFQTSQSQRIIFLLDCGRMMTNLASGLSLLDHSLNAMLMLSFVALRQGDSVGLICFSDRVHNFVPPRGGMKQMNQLLHASFDRFPELVESRFDDAFVYLRSHCPKRSLVVLITNVIDEVNSNQIEQYLSTLVGRHLPLGVLLRDHHLFDEADIAAPRDTQLYRAAAAAEILTWRHQVLTDLEHNGVLTIDVFPEDMTAPLVNRYLEIKARHLL
jgi:uncharacterized protein (DUF58 family)